MEEQYNTLRTAISRSGLSVTMRELVNLNIFNLTDRCIDIGCGKGQDVTFLRYMGVNIVGYDKYNPKYNNDIVLHNQYDLLTCNYVFNVIDLDEHKQLLNKIKLLSENIYISVRSDTRAIKSNWKYIAENDYWLTPKGTYQRFYDEEMVYKYFGQVEYIINNKSLKLFKLIK